MVSSSISMVDFTPKHYESQQNGVLSKIPQSRPNTNMDMKMGMLACATSPNTSASSKPSSFFLISLPHMELSHKCHNWDISHHLWWWCRQGKHIFQIYPIFIFTLFYKWIWITNVTTWTILTTLFMSRALEPPIIKFFQLDTRISKPTS